MIRHIFSKILAYLTLSEEYDDVDVIEPEIYLHNIVDWGVIGFLYGLGIAYWVTSHTVLQIVAAFIGSYIAVILSFLLNKKLTKMFGNLGDHNSYNPEIKSNSNHFDKICIPILIILGPPVCLILLVYSIKFSIMLMIDLLIVGTSITYGGFALFFIIYCHRQLVQKNIIKKLN